MLVSISACKPTPPMDSSYIAEIKNHFSIYYSLRYEHAPDIEHKDSLRAEQFFSPSLRKAIFFNYKGKLAGSNHSSKADFTITIYEYLSADAPIKIVKEFEAEGARRIEEGAYGPLDKNYQFFLQDSNYLVHFEALCTSSKEKKWHKIQDSLINITVKHFGSIYKEYTKPCE